MDFLCLYKLNNDEAFSISPSSRLIYKLSWISYRSGFLKINYLVLLTAYCSCISSSPCLQICGWTCSQFWLGEYNTTAKKNFIKKRKVKRVPVLLSFLLFIKYLCLCMCDLGQEGHLNVENNSLETEFMSVYRIVFVWTTAVLNRMWNIKPKAINLSLYYHQEEQQHCFCVIFIQEIYCSRLQNLCKNLFFRVHTCSKKWKCLRFREVCNLT